MDCPQNHRSAGILLASWVQESLFTCQRIFSLLLNQYQTSASDLQEVKKKVTTFASKFEDQDDAMADLKRKFKVVEGMANSAHKSSFKKKSDDD